MIKCLGVDPAVNSGLVLLGVEDRQHILLESSMLAFRDLKGFARLRASRKAMIEYLIRTRPDCVVIEGYAYGNKFSLATAVEFGTVYRLACMDLSIPIFSFSPLSLKKFITGKAAAKKNLIVMEVYKQWGFTAATDDIADAYGLSLAGLINKGAVKGTGLQRDAVSTMQLLSCN